MQLTDGKDQMDVNYNNLIQCCLEVLDEVSNLSSHLGNIRTESTTKNIEELRRFLLLLLDIQRKTAWGYIPYSYKKIMSEQSGLLSKNLVQSIRNLDFAYSYFATQYLQNSRIWSDYASILMQNTVGAWGVYVNYQPSAYGFLYEQDKQFVEAICDIEKEYENFDHSQNPNRKTKSKSVQNYSKTTDDTSESSMTQ
ncbi:MAG: hypothetical protein KGI27_05255 [Thaumarchaeota archaeon]|nr:hypothetical protein [Nitrososphaerota archaeon]